MLTATDMCQTQAVPLVLELLQPEAYIAAARVLCSLLTFSMSKHTPASCSSLRCCRRLPLTVPHCAEKLP